MAAKGLIAVDSSALAAVIFREPEAERFRRLLATRWCVIGVPTLLEAHFVASRAKQGDGQGFLDLFASQPNVEMIAFGEAHLAIARAAFDRYGKGRGHPAALNFGDCMAYAVAKLIDAPLLYKGHDFALTDIAPAP